MKVNCFKKHGTKEKYIYKIDMSVLIEDKFRKDIFKQLDYLFLHLWALDDLVMK